MISGIVRKKWIRKPGFSFWLIRALSYVHDGIRVQMLRNLGITVVVLLASTSTVASAQESWPATRQSILSSGQPTAFAPLETTAPRVVPHGTSALVSQGGSTFDESLLKYIALGNTEVRTMVSNEIVLGTRAGEGLGPLTARIVNAAYRVGTNDAMRAGMAVEVVDQTRLAAASGRLPGYGESQAAAVATESAIIVGQHDPGYVQAFMTAAIDRINSRPSARDADVLVQALERALASPAISPAVLAVARNNGISPGQNVAGDLAGGDAATAAYATGAGGSRISSSLSFGMNDGHFPSPGTSGRSDMLSPN